MKWTIREMSNTLVTSKTKYQLEMRLEVTQTIPNLVEIRKMKKIQKMQQKTNESRVDQTPSEAEMTNF